MKQTLSIRVSHEMYDAVQMAAALAGTTPSQWCEQQLTEVIPWDLLAHLPAQLKQRVANMGEVYQILVRAEEGDPEALKLASDPQWVAAVVHTAKGLGA